MPATNPPTRLFFFVWGGGLFLILLFVAVTKLFPDARTRELRHAPGLDLVFPDGVELDSWTTDSLFDAGAYLMRGYGTDAPAERITAFYDAALARLGYTKVTPTPDAGFSGGTIIGQYVNGPFTFRLFLVPPPTRLGGRTYTTEFKHYLHAKLGD